MTDWAYFRQKFVPGTVFSVSTVYNMMWRRPTNGSAPEKHDDQLKR